MLRIRSTRLLSGVSAIAMIAGAGVLSPVMAAATFTGPFVTAPITNSQTDTVSINTAATIDKNAGANASDTAASTNGDSFYNGLNMTGAGIKLDIQDSYLLGDIENVGTMQSSNNDAIFIGKGSQIGGRVFNSGLIDGQGGTGIELAGASTITGGISNVGTILGGAGDGININVDSEVFGGIKNTGLISGTSDGIDFDDANVDFFGGITNTGTIQGGSSSGIEWEGHIFNGGIANNAGGTISGADGILMDNGTFNGGITNAAGATILGNVGAAIRLSGGTFTNDITNSGLISGISSADGIRVDAGTFSGGITNNTSGTISASGVGADGIEIAGGTFSNGIVNHGTIVSDTSTGIYIHGAAIFAGGISNSGTIHAESRGIYITNTGGFTGGITNDGLIRTDGVSGDGIQIAGTSFTGGILNNGTIDAASDGISWTAGTFTNNITNNGSIIARSGNGLLLTGTTLTGSVTNNGLLTGASTYDGIYVGATATITGDITNGGEGVINAGFSGIYVAGTVNGSVTNNGIIDPLYGITIAGAVHGEVANNDLIEATIDGIRITNSGTIDDGISNSGTVLAAVNAINLSGEGAATTISQTGGLIQGNSAFNGSGTVTTALRLDQTGTDYADTFTASAGQLDGNVVGDGSDHFTVNTSTTFAYLRGTASGIDDINVTGNGTFLLGAATRGQTNGAGVTFGANNLYFSGKGRIYVDDNTTVNLTNAYFQGSNNTVEFYLTSDTTTHGQINAGGEGLILDGRIAAYVNGTSFGSVGGDTFTYDNVMTGGVSGTFTNASNIDTNSLFFTGEALVNASDVDIVLHRESFADALVLPGMTQNEMSVGDVLDKIYALGPGPGGYGTDFSALFDYLLSLTGGEQGDALFVYNEISGEEHAQLQQTTLDILNPFNTFMGQRLDMAKTSQGGVGFAALGGSQYAQATSVMSDASPGMARGPSGISLWARGYGQRLTADGDVEAPGYHQDTGGAAGGIDLALGENSVVGAAGGWSTTDVKFKTPGDKANVDSWEVGAYGSLGLGRFYLDGELAGAFHDLTTTRFLNLPNPPGGAVAGANYNARSFSANGEFGAVWRSGNFIFQPNAGVMFTDVDTDTFIESGGGDFDLIVHDQSAQSLASSLGARFATQFKAGGMNIMPEVSAAWRHEFDDDRQTFTAAFPDDPTSTFNIISSKINADSALVEAGVTAGVTKNVELFLNYNGLLNSDVDVHNGSAGLRATW